MMKATTKDSKRELVAHLYTWVLLVRNVCVGPWLESSSEEDHSRAFRFVPPLTLLLLLPSPSGGGGAADVAESVPIPVSWALHADATSQIITLLSLPPLTSAEPSYIILNHIIYAPGGGSREWGRVDHKHENRQRTYAFNKKYCKCSVVHRGYHGGWHSPCHQYIKGVQGN